MSNMTNPDGSHKVIAGYSHANGLNERDQRIKELEAQLTALRRSLDNIKVRSYELGQRELHDMALAALLEVSDE